MIFSESTSKSNIYHFLKKIHARVTDILVQIPDFDSSLTLLLQFPLYCELLFSLRH
jgi:hypothetical protein